MLHRRTLDFSGRGEPPHALGFVRETAPISYVSATSFRVNGRYARPSAVPGKLCWFGGPVYTPVVSTNYDGTNTTVVVKDAVCWPGMSKVMYQASTGGIDGETRILQHFDGSLTDEVSKMPNPYTVYGSLSYSTTVKKFGTKSLYLGAGCFYNWFNLTNADFTIEYWLYMNSYSVSNANSFSGQYNRSAYSGMDIITDSSRVCWGGGVDGTYITSATVLPLATWNHIRFGRRLNTLYLFANGILLGTCTKTGLLNGSDYFYIGGGGGGYNWFDGYIDEFCASSICRSTESFTPTTSPYTY